ncbi:MAG: GtrA family protein [Thermoprotei archaeon]
MESDIDIAYVETGIGSLLGIYRLVHGKYLNRKNLNTVFLRDKPLLLILDIGYRYRDLILEEIRSSDLDNIVVFKIKLGFIGRILSRFLKNPLDKLVHDNGIIAIYIPRDKNLTNNYTGTRVIHIDLNTADRARALLSGLPRPLAIIAEPLRIMRFALVGFTGFLVNLAVLYAVRSLLLTYLDIEISTALATMISFETSLTWNFILHELWTFRDLRLSRTLQNRVKRWIKYHLGSIGSLLSQVSIVTLLSGFMNYPLYLSLLLGVLVGLIANYLLSRFFAWRE